MSTQSTSSIVNFDAPMSWISPLERRPAARRALTGAAQVTSPGLVQPSQPSDPVILDYVAFRRSVHRARGLMLADTVRWIGARITGRRRNLSTEL